MGQLKTGSNGGVCLPLTYKYLPLPAQGSNEAMSKKATKSQLEVLQQEREHTLTEIEHLESDLRKLDVTCRLDNSTADLAQAYFALLGSAQAFLFHHARQ